jgi:hypothetical protein
LVYDKWEIISSNKNISISIMPDQARRTSKVISNVLVLYKIGMYMWPIRKYGRSKIKKNMFPG